jgi:hypothetical protein
MNISKLKKIAAFILMVLVTMGLYAQTGIDSPYSRFGIGQLENKSANARLKAMGGISNAIGSNSFINNSNPATYARFDSLSFLFNAGVSAGSATLRTSTQSESASNSRLTYMSVGFPVTPWWRASAGLLPYSSVAYDVLIPIQNELTGNYAKTFSGSGGLNRFYVGSAIAITKSLSVGVNANYVFGKSNNDVLLHFFDSVYYANTKIENKIQVNSFMFDYGLFYVADIGNNFNLHAGISYSQEMNLTAKREYAVKSITGGVNGNLELIRDTIDYRPEEEGKLIMPQGIGLGLAIEKKNSWLVGADFNWQNWEKFEAFGQSDSLTNAWNIAIGGQYTPPHTSISKYWKRITYRAGLRYDQTYLNLRGEAINEFGISFGMGLPVPRSLTSVDVSLELGRRGTVANNLVQETFVNFTLGVAIYERWFVKRRYH